jgi:hypothetical protein
VDDSQLLAKALPNLEERTGVKTMMTDGGYGGESSDASLQEQGVKLVQSAIRGLQPDPGQFHLSDFDLKSDSQAHPITLTCPNGQTVIVTPHPHLQLASPLRPGHLCRLSFPTRGALPHPTPKTRSAIPAGFHPQEILTAERRKDYLAHKGDAHNLRSAVEATMRSVKHAFPSGKLPVRGKFRVTCMTIASAAIINVRRIHRYRVAKTKWKNEHKQTSQKQDCAQSQPNVSFLLR